MDDFEKYLLNKIFIYFSKLDNDYYDDDTLYVFENILSELIEVFSEYTLNYKLY